MVCRSFSTACSFRPLVVAGDSLSSGLFKKISVQAGLAGGLRKDFESKSLLWILPLAGRLNQAFQ
jgi:hypothetical protein